MNIVVQLRPISGYSIDGGQQSRLTQKRLKRILELVLGLRVL